MQIGTAKKCFKRYINTNVMKKIKSYITITLFLAMISMVFSNIPVHSSSNNELQAYQVHTVKAGDSLSKIAKEYYDDYNRVSLIARFNNIKDINRLKIGQKIKIPILSLAPPEKSSTLEGEDLGISKRGEAETLEEKSLNKKTVNSILDGPTLLFIIIYLFVMLSLLLIKWLGRQDAHQAKKSGDDDRQVGRHKWRL